MSQMIRATFSPVGPIHGKTRKVERSGRRYMSDSSMRTNPSKDNARDPGTFTSTGSGNVARLSTALHNYGDASRAARRPHGKARRPRIAGLFEGGATQPGGMHRRPNATVIVKRSTKGRV